MKKIRWFILTVMLLGSLLSNAQQIKKYEYWIDDGFESRVQQNISPLTTYFNSVQVDFTKQSVGLHSLHVRYQDTNGEWSAMLTKPVYKLPISEHVKINGYEYWIDDRFSDRVFELINPENPLDKDVVLDLSSYEDGLHLLQIRFRDNYENWGAVVWRFFLKQTAEVTPHLVTSYRYWIDDNTEDISTVQLPRAVPQTEVNTDVQLADLERGMHVFYIQFLDTKGNWSSAIGARFEMMNCHPYKPVAPYNGGDICKGELVSYFWTTGAADADSYEWYMSPTLAGKITGSGNKATVTWDEGFFGDVEVWVKGRNICGLGESSDTLSTVVLPIPTAPRSPEGEQVFCVNPPNSSYSVEDVEFADSYTWSLTPSNAGILTVDPADSKLVSVNWKKDYLGKASITVSGNNVCGVAEAAVPLELFVSELPDAPTISASGPTSFCVGGSVELIAFPASNYSYLWSNDLTDKAIEVDKGGDYTVVVIDTSGCVSAPSEPFKVDVYNLPEAPVITQVGLELRSSSRYGNQWYTSVSIIPGANELYYIPSELGNYRVQITDDQGCQNMSGLFYYKGLAVEPLFKGVNLYPNPNRGEFTLQTKVPLIGLPKVEVFDNTGRSIPFSLRYSERKFHIQLVGAVSGQYFIKLQVGNEKTDLPFVVDK